MDLLLFSILYFLLFVEFAVIVATLTNKTVT